MNTAGKVLIGIAVAVIAVGIAVGGYLGGWWLQKDINNRSAHIRRTTFEQQTTYRDEMIRKIADVRAIDAQIAQSPDARAELGAQRKAIVAIVCRDNTHINGGLDSDTAAFVSQECA
jgi:uncharacterized protein HemX